jgi:hypothetical protein
MAERSDVYSYFWIEGFDCPCEDITAQMQLTPSRTARKGTLRENGLVEKRDFWEFHSPLKRGEHLIQESLEALLPVLESRIEEVLNLSSRYRTGINCVGYYYGSNPGLHLAAELIQRISALQLSVDFDLYNYAEENAS